MADNVTLNSGSGGATLAADDISSVWYQRVKITLGADGAADTDVDSGQQTSANSVPVVIASDQDFIKSEDAVHSTGDDGIMALAVRNDTLAALAGTDGDYAPLQVNASGALFIQEGAALDVSGATVTVDLGANNDVTIDGSSIVKAEDAVHSSGDAGVMALAVRQDSQVDFGADGDYVPLSIDANGALRVSGGGGGTEYNEDDATPNPIVGTASLMERDDALATLTPIEGDWVGMRSNARGALWVELDLTNDVTIADGGNSITVDGTVTANPASGTIDTVTTVTTVSTVTAVTDITGGVVPGVGAADLGKAEDAVHGSGDTGVMSLAVRNDTLAALAGTDGDYAPFQVNASGALFIQEGAAMDVSAATVNVASASALDVSAATVTVDLGANNDVTIDGSTIVKTVDAVAGTDTGIAALAVRDDELAAQAADGDYVQLRTDQFGRLRTTNMGDTTSVVKYAVIDAAGSGDNTLVAAAGAGIKIKVLAAFMVAAGTVNARFESGAAGTALTGQMNLVANSGFTLPFNPEGWFETADNTLLNLELSAAISVDGCLVYVED